MWNKMTHPDRKLKWKSNGSYSFMLNLYKMVYKFSRYKAMILQLLYTGEWRPNSTHENKNKTCPDSYST